jgi:sec-independent protein translocase protein TatA
MPSLGPMELVLILLIVIIIFGVGRLPEVGSAVGKAFRGFRDAVSGEDEESKKAEKKPEEKETKS